MEIPNELSVWALNLLTCDLLGFPFAAKHLTDVMDDDAYSAQEN